MFRPAFVHDTTSPNRAYFRNALNISAQYAFLAKTNRDEFYKAMLRWDSDYNLRKEVIKSVFFNMNPEERKSFFDDFVWNDGYKPMYGHHILIQDFVGVLTELLAIEAATPMLPSSYNPLLFNVVNKAVKHVFGVMKDDGYFRDIIMSESEEEIINEDYKKDLVAAIFNIFSEDKLIAIINYIGASEKLHKSPTGYTALHFAILRDLLPLAEILIAKGANVNAEDELGFTPLHVAKSKAAAEFLVARGALSTISKYHKATPLSLAIAKGNVELISYLESLPQPLPEVTSLEAVTVSADTDSLLAVHTSASADSKPVFEAVETLLGDIMTSSQTAILSLADLPTEEEWSTVRSRGKKEEFVPQEMSGLIERARFLSEDLGVRSTATITSAAKFGSKKKKRSSHKASGGGGAGAASVGEVPDIDNEKLFSDLLRSEDFNKLKHLLGNLPHEEAIALVAKNQEVILTLLDKNSKNSADIIKCFLIYGAELPAGSTRKIMAVRKGRENFLQSIQKFDGKERLLFAALNGLDNIFIPGFTATQNADDVFAAIEEIVFKYPEINKEVIKNLIEVFVLDKRKTKSFFDETISSKLRRNPSLSEGWKSYYNPESNYELTIMGYLAKEDKSDLLEAIIDAVGIEEFQSRFESFNFRDGICDVATMACSFGKVGILQRLCEKGGIITKVGEKISIAKEFIHAARASRKPQFVSQITNFQQTIEFLESLPLAPRFDVGRASGVILDGDVVRGQDRFL